MFVRGTGFVKQQPRIWSLRVLTSRSHHESKSPLQLASLFASRWSIASKAGVIIGILGTLYYAKNSYEESKKANEDVYRKSFDFSKEQLKWALHQQFPKPVYKLPEFKRNNLHLHVLNRANEKILLIEGPSGSGKTLVAKELIYDVSKTRNEGNRRGILYFAPRKPARKSMAFFDEIVSNFQGYVGPFNGYDVLRIAFQESCKENDGNRSLLVIDDAQKLAVNDMAFDEIMGMLRSLVDNDDCDIILIVSNGSVLKKARGCSGLSSEARLDYLKWPHVPDEEMERYIQDNREQIFQKAQVNDAQIAKIVRLFDSSFSDLRAIGAQENVDAYMEKRLTNRRKVLRAMLNHHQEKSDVLKKVYKARNHIVSVDELGGHSDIAEQLVNSNFLAYVDEVSYVFHDRLTLEAMAEEMKSIQS